MSPIILENQGKGTMRGILVDSANSIQQFDLGDFSIEAKLSGRPVPDIAGGIIIQTGPHEYMVAGKAFDVLFFSKNDSLRIAVNAVDEGVFDKGKWIPTRRLNGDEVHASTWSGTGVKLPDDKISIQKISIYQYK